MKTARERQAKHGTYPPPRNGTTPLLGPSPGAQPLDLIRSLRASSGRRGRQVGKRVTARPASAPARLAVYASLARPGQARRSRSACETT